MMLPAALSILTTTFKEGSDRNTALGVWGAIGGLASAAGVLLGGLLTEGPGWRWVMFVNPLAARARARRDLLADRRRASTARGSADFDFRGAILATGGMLLLVFALVKAPDQGWGAARTIAELAGALALLAAFVVNERRSSNPLLPLSIFRVKGLAAADATQLIAFAGFLSMFFFLTLYMQNVLGYSPIQTGAAYLPLTFGVGVAAGIASQLLPRIGTRPVIVGGSLIAAGGVYWLSRIPVHGSYSRDLLPGLWSCRSAWARCSSPSPTAANAGVPADKAGLAAALLNASQQVGARARTGDLLRDRHLPHQRPAGRATPPPRRRSPSGFQRALLASSIFLVAAALVAPRITNTRGEPAAPEVAPESAGLPQAARA